MIREKLKKFPILAALLFPLAFFEIFGEELSKRLKRLAFVVIIAFPMVLFIAFGVDFWLERNSELAKSARMQAQREAAMWQYEDRFRTTMVRVYQNLRLGHMLAAYRNLESFQEPPASQTLLSEEYFEIIERIASGLLESRFLDESERFWQRLEAVSSYRERAEAALTRVAAYRLYQSALRYLQNGRQRLEEQLFFESINELKKAKLELDVLQQYEFLDLQEDMARWRDFFKMANYSFNQEKAKEYLVVASADLEGQNFAGAQRAMYLAAGHVGKMAYYSSEIDESVSQLREALHFLRDDMGFRIPNSMPVYNLFSRENLHQFSNHFYLERVKVSFDSKFTRDITLDFELAAQTEGADFYVIRYKTYFFNGQVYFNSMILRNEAESLRIVENLPDRLKGAQVKRVDISVYDSSHVLISRWRQAFRRPEI